MSNCLVLFNLLAVFKFQNLLLSIIIFVLVNLLHLIYSYSD